MYLVDWELSLVPWNWRNYGHAHAYSINFLLPSGHGFTQYWSLLCHALAVSLPIDPTYLYALWYWIPSLWLKRKTRRIPTKFKKDHLSFSAMCSFLLSREFLLNSRYRPCSARAHLHDRYWFLSHVVAKYRKMFVFLLQKNQEISFCILQGAHAPLLNTELDIKDSQ